MLKNIIKLTLLFAGIATNAFAQHEALQHSQVFNEMNNHAKETTHKIDTATFGAGCYWCTEAQFQQLDGVIKVVSGFSGGHVANPTYKDVCTGTTGHAEVCDIYYDPSKISYDELLAAFWMAHDPTQLNKQGNDVGTQYRSVIFYHNNMQREKAEFYKKKLNEAHIYPNPVVTEITAFNAFYPAPDQDYYNQNGQAPYCTYVIRPKVENFRKVFKDKLKQ